jgi:hypothetical protein
MTEIAKITDSAQPVLLAATEVSLRGIVGEILPPTSVEVAQGGLTIITGGSQLAKNALGLTLTGRMTGYKGLLHLSNNLSLKQLRLTSALIDAPKLSEPDEWMPLGKFATGELKIGRQPHTAQAVANFLQTHNALDYINTKMGELPVKLMYTLVIELVKLRQNSSGEQLVKTFCFVSPGRHDTKIENWGQPILSLFEANSDYTVILICQESIYEYLQKLYPQILQDLGATRYQIGNPQPKGGE